MDRDDINKDDANRDNVNMSMPSGTPSLTAKITSGVRVHLTALLPDFKVDQPVYALNWFNSRQLWLYNFYNLLAARSVLKVGGVPFFKARVATTLHGHDADYRSVLLIVRYPDINHFKTMLQSRYFQCVSIIRGLAVAQFTFGFSTRTDIQDNGEFTNQSRIAKNMVYAIHHYRLSEQASDIAERASELAPSHQVKLAFSSRVSARLYPQKGSTPPEAVDTIMDGCMIMQADTQAQVEQLVASPEYKALLATSEASFIATLDRIF